jgi:NAD(P)-dependent dehydrogenase (short-subunit alcohol dehydrogenase family)
MPGKGKTFFTGKIAFISGSNAGIGKALALEVAKLGGIPVLNGRNTEKLEAALVEVKKYAPESISIPGDISDPYVAEQTINTIVQKFGRLDILVNNAGISAKGTVEKTKPEVFEEITKINYLGTVYLTHYALPYLKNSRGRLLFVSSIVGIYGLPNYGGYCSSKAPLTTLAETLRVELHGTGVKTSIAYVGFTENEPDKYFLNAKGEREILQERTNVNSKTQQETALLLLRQIKKGKFKDYHSLFGFLSISLKRYFPRLYHEILRMNRKKFYA